MIFLYAYILNFLIFVSYYFLFFKKIIEYSPPNYNLQTLPFPPASIIICAKNEAQNLAAFLPNILQQQYPTQYQVIVCNHHSTDNTLPILNQLQLQYPHLTIITPPPTFTQYKGKKPALQYAIQYANYEHLVLTDADCYPASKQWLQAMIQPFVTRPNTDIVLGYSPYIFHKNFLNYCIQYETLLTAAQYLSHALCQNAYMGVGRNLAYTKKIFNQIQGFKKHNHIVSGDDDLFINEVATPHNTTIQINPNAFCYSIPPNTWQEWYNQKKRHLSTAKYYKLKHKILLIIFAINHFFLYIGTIFAITIPKTIFYIPITIIIFIFSSQVTINYIFFKKIRIRLHSPLPPLFILLLHFLYIFYYLLFSPFTLFFTKIKWKINS